MSAASLIAGHLNAPYGPIVCEQDVIDSLKNGFLSAKTKTANEIIATIFLENSPSLILRCCREITASPELVENLYKQCVQITQYRSTDWEDTTLSSDY